VRRGISPRWAAAFAIVAATGACDLELPRASSPDAPAARPVDPNTPLRGPEARLFSIEGLAAPEAVRYDPDADVYLISNFGSGDDPEANDGFIARARAEDGEIETLHWAVGDERRPLQDPRGMALSGDTLWIADARGAHAFARYGGAQLRFVDLTGLEPGFLNDVAVGPDGGVYLTDTGRSRLLRLSGDSAIVVAEGDALGSPNGLTYEPSTGAFVLVPWEGGGDSLRAWHPVFRTLTVRARSPGGRFDGVEVVEGRLVVASQADSALHWVGVDRGVPFQKVPGRPADIAVDTRRGHIAVPYIALDRVDVFPGPPGG
jgi:hypothetical protein